MSANKGSTSSPRSRYEAFAFGEQQVEFGGEITAILREWTRQLRNRMIPPENTLRYSHGESWLVRVEDSAEEEREFTEHSTEVLIPFEDIVAHKIEILPKYIQDLLRESHKQFMTTLFSTVHEAMKRAGRVVNTKESGSTAAAFLEMLRRTEFGVDRAGEPVIPTLYGGKLLESFSKELEAQGDEFRREVETLIAEKKTRALQTEAKRRAKFRKLE